MRALEAEVAACAGGALGADDLRADFVRVNYGCGARNPLDLVHFFDERRSAGGVAVDGATGAVPHARRQPASTYAAMLPGAFEESSLRLFVVDPSAEALDAARTAFGRWSERQGALCSGDKCELRT